MPRRMPGRSGSSSRIAKKGLIVYDFDIDEGTCHDSTRGLFLLKHNNLARTDDWRSEGHGPDRLHVISDL